MSLGPHASFIVAAYIVTVVVVIGLIAWILRDYAAQRRILGDLEQLSEGGFDNGWVYDPKEGKSYSVALDLIGPDTLKVTGYKGMRFLGKSFIWTRAPADLPSCSQDSVSAPDASNQKMANTKATSPAKAGKTASNKGKTKKAATPQHPVASN